MFAATMPGLFARNFHILSNIRTSKSRLFTADAFFANELEAGASVLTHTLDQTHWRHCADEMGQKCEYDQQATGHDAWIGSFGRLIK